MIRPWVPAVLGDMSLVLTLVGLCLVMAGAWLIQRLTRNIGWVDVVWSFGTAAAGILLALVWGGGSTPRGAMVAVIAAVWGLRLGLHVAFRVAGSQEDGRYRELRQDWGARLQPRLFGFLQVQALVSTGLAAAIALAAERPGAWPDAQDVLGVAIAVVAVAGETIADRQLAAFAADPANRGKVCDRGLWAWSRHPNYFFEWLAWFAYPAIAISPRFPEGAWALIAPLAMYLVLRHGTGVPPLEAHMLKSRGQAFRDYQARVSLFIPRPPRNPGSRS